MKVIRLFVIAMSAVLLLAGAGCKSTEKTKLGEFDPNDNEALKVAKTFADDILTKNLSPEMREKMTEKTFKATVKEMTDRVGTLQNWTYLTVMDKTPLKAFVWKASFQKEIKDKDNKPLKLDTDMLFQLFIGKTDKGYVILIFAFQ